MLRPIHLVLPAVATALLGVVSAASAGEAGGGGSVAVTTDYVFRGLSQTSGGPALQADAHYQTQGGLYAGAWTSTINPQEKDIGYLELNLYAGWAWDPSPDWSTRLGYVRYLYPDSREGTSYDYGELSATLGWRDRIFGTVGWSPDMVRATYYGVDHRGRALSYEVSLRQPLWRVFGAAVGVGYYDLEDVLGTSYWAWNATLTANFDRVEFDLAYFASDDTARDLFGRESAADRWALTALWRFK